jgi:hypothetical protein
MVYNRSFTSEGNVSFFLAWCFLLLFFSRVALVIIQQLPPLPPYVRSSRAAPDKVLSTLSVVAGAGASTLAALPICTVFFSFRRGSTFPQGPIPPSLYPA